MKFTESPLYVLTILLLLIGLADWLGKKKYFRHIGSVLLIIIAAAVLANLDVIPSFKKGSVIYDGIFSYAAPIGIFFLMLDVRLNHLKKAGLPMIAMFLVGAAGAIIGDFISYYIIQPQDKIENAHAVAGMFTGTYVGGSANLNAIALHYGVNKDGTAFAAINAADNIVSALWTMTMMLIVPFLHKLKPRARFNHDAEEVLHPEEHQKDSLNVLQLSLLLAIGIATFLVSQYLSELSGKTIPSILILTTIALIIAQMPFMKHIRGSQLLGYFLILLFLAVVGAFCDIAALVENGQQAMMLFTWILLLILIHGIIIFGIGWFFKQDWYVIAISSIAGIGGPTSSAAVATTMGRTDLRLPAILVGTTGYAIGTYLGILVAEILK